MKKETKFQYTAHQATHFEEAKVPAQDWKGVSLDAFDHDLSGLLSTGDSRNVPLVQDNSASLVVTSPPFLDVVDYQGDNWLRCWFIGVDSSTIEISQLKAIEDWEDTMTDVLKDLKRIVKPGGHIAFEVGGMHEAERSCSKKTLFAVVSRLGLSQLSS